MDKTLIITGISPALILFLVAIVVRFSPPSKESNSLLLKVPEWWSRDDATWHSAYGFLAKKYLYYSVLLAVICTALLFLAPTYGATLGYFFLLLFFAFAQFQVRQFMNKEIK